MSKKTEITVANQSVRVVEYQGQRVVTLGMIDQVHNRPEGTARRNFNENRTRFIEGEDFVKVTANEFRTRNPGAISNKATEDVTIFTEAGYLMLVKSFNDDLAWQVQRQLVNRYFRKTGSYSAGQQRQQTLTRNQVAASILLLRSAKEDLSLAPSAVLGGYQKLEAQLGVPGLLPAYAVDDGGDSAGSSRPTNSATWLLKQHGEKMSASKFNAVVTQLGFLEEKSRKSSKAEGGIKHYKSITSAGLAYGKNATSPANQKETQPLWYEDSFADLLDLVAGAAANSGANEKAGGAKQ